MAAQWDDVVVALHVSAYSLKALADAFVPLMGAGGSFLGLDFDNRARGRPTTDGGGQVGTRVDEPLPGQGARPQGIRCNLVAAGPVKTMAAKSIPGFKRFEDVWDDQAAWDGMCQRLERRRTVVRRLALGLVPATTGEMIHVDGGFHAVGAEPGEPYDCSAAVVVVARTGNVVGGVDGGADVLGPGRVDGGAEGGGGGVVGGASNDGSTSHPS